MAGKLDVLGHDGDMLGMDGAQVGSLKASWSDMTADHCQKLSWRQDHDHLGK